MSLANRVAFLAVGVLVASGVVMGVSYYGAVERSLRSGHEATVRGRRERVESAIEADFKGGLLRLNAYTGLLEPDVEWRIETPDGGALWISEPGPDNIDRETTVHEIVLGDAEAPAPNCSGIRLADRDLRGIIHREDLFESVRDAVAESVPGLVVTDIGRPGDRFSHEPSRRVVGIASTREYRLEIARDGSVLSRESRGYVKYSLPANCSGLRLKITIAAPRSGMHKELARLAAALWTIGPVVTLLAGALLWFLVTRQLRPLGRMAAEAAHIGPGSPDLRISEAGASAECLRLREALNSMLDRLAEGLARERRFASTAAHELRGPLAQMRTAVEVAARRDRDASEYREALTETLGDIERLQRLIEGLLQLARASDRALPGGRQASLSLALERAGRDGLECVPADGMDNTDVLVRGEDELLYRALSNVIENAHRYAGGVPPSVSLDLDMDAGRAQLKIADSGPGVACEDRERIFEPLTRLDEARTITGTADGFGLGLAVARSIVRSFGGDLECRGREDGSTGALFVFTFELGTPG